MRVLLQKAWEINAVRKRNDSNCAGILSDQGEAVTVSNLSEYTMKYVQSPFTYLQHPPVPTPGFSLYFLDIWLGEQAKR